MPVSLSPISADVLLTVGRGLAQVCQITGPVESAGVIIDADALTESEQDSFDDGEILPSWSEWWHSQADLIRGFEGAALITLEPGSRGRRRVQSLDAQRLNSVFGTVAWTRCAGVVLAWGLPSGMVGQVVSGSLPCAGALAVVIDGCGALLTAERHLSQGWSW